MATKSLTRVIIILPKQQLLKLLNNNVPMIMFQM